jgi:hypothetical protein
VFVNTACANPALQSKLLRPEPAGMIGSGRFFV